MRLFRRKRPSAPPHFCERCMAINTGSNEHLCPPCLGVVIALGQRKREWQW